MAPQHAKAISGDVNVSHHLLRPASVVSSSRASLTGAQELKTRTEQQHVKEILKAASALLPRPHQAFVGSDNPANSMGAQEHKIQTELRLAKGTSKAASALLPRLHQAFVGSNGPANLMAAQGRSIQGKEQALLPHAKATLRVVAASRQQILQASADPWLHASSLTVLEESRTLVPISGNAQVEPMSDVLVFLMPRLPVFALALIHLVPTVTATALQSVQEVRSAHANPDL